MTTCSQLEYILYLAESGKKYAKSCFDEKVELVCQDHGHILRIHHANFGRSSSLDCLVGETVRIYFKSNPRAWLSQRVQVHFWTKYLGLNLAMTPKVLYQSLDTKMWVHLIHFLTLICNIKIWGVNVVLNHLFWIQPLSDIWIIIPTWRL